jgi:hypothetical protein
MFEKYTLESSPNQPLFWCRYIDDTDMKWRDTEENLDSSLHQSLSWCSLIDEVDMKWTDKYINPYIFCGHNFYCTKWRNVYRYIP